MSLGVNAASASSTSLDTTLTDEQIVQRDLDTINLPRSMITSFPVTTQSVYGSKITWSSITEDVTNTSYVEETGWVEVIRDENEDKNAILTVTVTKGTYMNSKELHITVPKGITRTKQLTLSYVVFEEGLIVPEALQFNTGKHVALPTLSETGYIFKGWYDNPQYTGRRYTTTLGMISNKTLYAKFEQVILRNIEVTTQPTKTFYTALESFDSTGLVVTATYSDNSTKVVPLSELSFNKTVLHGYDSVVTVSYGDKTANIYIIVEMFTMTGVTFEDKTVTYNGNEHGIEITGTLPEWLNVNYSDNQINAGIYLMTATFTLKDGYSDADYELPNQLSALLTINKAIYDMSDITFTNTSAVYDGNPKTITINGTIPDGVTVSYRYVDDGYIIDEIIDAGQYSVLVDFTINNENYDPIHSIDVTLYIEKATYNMDGVTLNDNTVTYDGNQKDLSLTGTLPDGVTYVLIYEVNNVVVYPIDAGVYKVNAFFFVDENHADIENKTATLTITKANPTVTMRLVDGPYYIGDAAPEFIVNESDTPGEITWEESYVIIEGTHSYNWVFTPYDANNYNGKTGSVELTGIVSEVQRLEITSGPTKTTYNAFETLDTTGLEVTAHMTNNTSKVLSPSEYTISYGNNNRFTVEDTSFIVIYNDDIQIVFDEIIVNHIEADPIVFDNKTVTYDGEAHNITIESELPNWLVVTYSPDKTEASETGYDVTATFAFAQGITEADKVNYVLPESITKKLIINKRTFDSSNVSLTGTTPIVYDGEAHTYTLTNSDTIPSWLTVSVSNATNAGTYTITATFALATGESTNNNIVPGNITKELVINKATYDMSGVSLNNETYTYDGSQKTLSLTGTLPAGVTAHFTYKFEDQIVNDTSHANIYTVTVSFTGDENNYNPIPSLGPATLTVEKADIKVTVGVNGPCYIGSPPPDPYIIESDIPGNVVWDGSFIVHEGSNSFRWMFIPSQGYNYNSVFGYMQITGVNADVVDIVIESGPTKTVYNAFDLLDKTGITVKAYREDGTSFYLEEDDFDVWYALDGHLRADDTMFVVSYGNLLAYKAGITVNPLQAGPIVFNDKTVIYDGNEHNIAIESQLPDWLVVNYSEPHIDACETGYNVTATFSLAESVSESDIINYVVPQSITKKLIINKATYDMEAVTLNDETVTYNGGQQSLSLNGRIPDGLEPVYTYICNSKSVSPENVINAGTYYATVYFINSNDNYNQVAIKTAVLTINKLDPIATVDVHEGIYYEGQTVPQISVSSSSVEGSVEWNELYTILEGTNSYTWKFIPNDSVNFNILTGSVDLTGIDFAIDRIEIKTQPTKKTYTAFDILDKTGLEVTAYNSDDFAIELSPNNYQVIYENGESFRYGDTNVSICYNDKLAQITGFTVNKIQMSPITYNDKTVTYNGRPQNITIEEEIPSWLVANYSPSQTTACETGYDMTVTFAFAQDVSIEDQENYLLPQSITKKLIINKASYKNNTYVEDKDVIYDGQPHTCVVQGQIPDGVTISYEYRINGEIVTNCINAGTYDVKVIFTGDDINYLPINEGNSTLTIQKANYDMSGVSFENKTEEYNGTAHSLDITGNLPTGVTASYTYKLNDTLVDTSEVINAGAYEVTVAFTHTNTNYKEVSNKTATLTISPKNTEFLVEDITDIIVSERTFAQVTPTLTVKADNNTLVLNIDYEVTYTDNTTILEGIETTATATVTGIGNYAGEKQATFIIKLSAEKRLAEDAIELSANSTVDSDDINTLPLTLSNGSRVTYTGAPTNLTIDLSTGEFTVIKTTEIQNPTFTAIVSCDNVVEYVTMTVVIHADQTFTDETTNVIIDNANEEISSVAVTQVEEITVANYEVMAGEQPLIAYNISLLNTNNIEIHQPGKPVTVKLPVPEGVTSDNVIVYHRSDEGVMTRVSGVTIVDGKVVFEASQFSNYVIAKELTYEVKFYNGSIQVGETITGKYNDSINKPSNPTKESTVQYTYTFVGWDGNNDGEVDTISTITDNLEYHALYTETINKYTLSFDTNGGSTIEAIEKEYGSAITKPTDPTKESVMFAGWYTTEEYTDEFVFDVIPNENTTIYAKWTKEVIEWKLVTNASDLEIHDVIVITNDDATKAIANMNSGNETVADVTSLNDGAEIAISDNVQQFTLTNGTVSDSFGLYNGSGYLDSSTNTLNTKSKLDTTGSWNITISDSIATFKSKNIFSKYLVYKAPYNEPNFSFSVSSSNSIRIYKYTVTVVTA